MVSKTKPKRKAAKDGREQDRRLVFAREYVIDHNGLQAAIRAGYSPKSAKVTASRLLTDANVMKLVQELDEKANESAFLRAEDVKRSLAQALLFDPRKLYSEDGGLLKVKDLDVDTAMALAGIEYGKTGIKLRWSDKNVAREQAMKHFGLYKDDNAQKTDPIRELLAAVNGVGKLEPRP